MKINQALDRRDEDLMGGLSDDNETETEFIYEFDGELGFSVSDENGWRSYGVNANGDDVEEFLNNATIIEIDREGEEVNVYPINQADEEVRAKCQDILKGVIPGLKIENQQRRLK